MSGQIPAHYMNRPGRSVGTAVAQGINASQPPRISIRGGRFSLIDASGEERPVIHVLTDARGQQIQQHATELDVIIVEGNEGLSKVYYEGAYDPTGDGGQPPTCFSDNHVAPSAQASKPQADTCAACQWNAWGSRVNLQTGQKSKACSDRKKLAVILAWGNDPIVYQLQVPPASLKNLQAMVFWAAQQTLFDRKADITDVITRISFQSGVTGVLEFAGAGLYDDATFQRIEYLVQNEQAKLDAICGKNDIPRTAGAIVAQTPAPQIAYQPQPAPPAEPQIMYSPPQGQQGGFTRPASVMQPQFQQPAPQAQTPPQAPRTRRGRRPAAEAPLNPQLPQGTPAPVQFQPQPVPVSPGPVQPQPMQVTPAPASVGTPQFLQPQPVQQVAPAQQQFGMVSSPAAPDPGLTAQLASVFGMKTQ